MKFLPPFHLAIPVHNLKKAHDFYGNLLNCQQGRSSSHWIDYNFFGHQLVVHLDEKFNNNSFNTVDGKEIPVPHFGLVLDWTDWQSLKDKLATVKVDFIVDPYIRFQGEMGEQATMFLLDPSSNALEFKAFKNIDQLFAH